MKKIASISLVLLGMVFLAGCDEQTTDQTEPTNQDAVEQESAQSEPTTQAQPDRSIYIKVGP